MDLNQFKPSSVNPEGALLSQNNLTDVKDPKVALNNLSGVPITRKINGIPLTQDITLTGSTNPKTDELVRRLWLSELAGGNLFS